MFKEELKKVPVIVLGNMLSATAVAFFIQPAGMLAGGCTGISLVLNSMLGLPVSVGLWAAKEREIRLSFAEKSMRKKSVSAEISVLRKILQREKISLSRKIMSPFSRSPMICRS